MGLDIVHQLAVDFDGAAALAALRVGDGDLVEQLALLLAQQVALQVFGVDAGAADLQRLQQHLPLLLIGVGYRLAVLFIAGQRLCAQDKLPGERVGGGGQRLQLTDFLLSLQPLLAGVERDDLPLQLRSFKIRLAKQKVNVLFLQSQSLQQSAQGGVGGNLVAALDAGESGAVADALAQLLLAQAQHIAPLADDDAEGILCHQEHLLFAFWKGDSGLELPFSIV